MAIASTQGGGVQGETIPVPLLGLRCAQRAGAHTEAVQKYVVVQPLQTALARVGSLCILGFLQHAVISGRKRGATVFAAPLKCLPCTLIFLRG